MGNLTKAHDRRPRTRLALAAVLAIALCAPVGIVGNAQGAKKGGGKAATEQASNVPIATPAVSGQLAKTNVPFEIGKKFKGRVVGTVEITTQVTGSAPGYLDDFFMRLISPQGRTVGLVAPPTSGFAPDQSYGPMKETPNSEAFACFNASDCFDPDALNPPYVGTVENLSFADFFGAKIRGTWTLRIIDVEVANNGVLNSAKLRVKPAEPIE